MDPPSRSPTNGTGQSGAARRRKRAAATRGSSSRARSANPRGMMALVLLLAIVLVMVVVYLVRRLSNVERTVKRTLGEVRHQVTPDDLHTAFGQWVEANPAQVTTACAPYINRSVAVAADAIRARVVAAAPQHHPGGAPPQVSAHQQPPHRAVRLNPVDVNAARPHYAPPTQPHYQQHQQNQQNQHQQHQQQQQQQISQSTPPTQPQSNHAQLHHQQARPAQHPQHHQNQQQQQQSYNRQTLGGLPAGAGSAQTQQGRLPCQPPAVAPLSLHHVQNGQHGADHAPGTNASGPYKDAQHRQAPATPYRDMPKAMGEPPTPRGDRPVIVCDGDVCVVVERALVPPSAPSHTSAEPRRVDATPSLLHVDGAPYSTAAPTVASPTQLFSPLQQSAHSSNAPTDKRNNDGGRDVQDDANEASDNDNNHHVNGVDALETNTDGKDQARDANVDGDSRNHNSNSGDSDADDDDSDDGNGGGGGDADENDGIGDEKQPHRLPFDGHIRDDDHIRHRHASMSFRASPAQRSSAYEDVADDPWSVPDESRFFVGPGDESEGDDDDGDDDDDGKEQRREDNDSGSDNEGENEDGADVDRHMWYGTHMDAAPMFLVLRASANGIPVPSGGARIVPLDDDADDDADEAEDEGGDDGSDAGVNHSGFSERVDDLASGDPAVGDDASDEDTADESLGAVSQEHDIDERSAIAGCHKSDKALVDLTNALECIDPVAQSESGDIQNESGEDESSQKDTEERVGSISHATSSNVVEIDSDTSADEPNDGETSDQGETRDTSEDSDDDVNDSADDDEEQEHKGNGTNPVDGANNIMDANGNEDEKSSDADEPADAQA